MGGIQLRLILEDILTSTALWADYTCLEQIEGEPLRKLTIEELDRLQHAIGELRQISRPMLQKIKYAGDE